MCVCVCIVTGVGEEMYCVLRMCVLTAHVPLTAILEVKRLCC